MPPLAADVRTRPGAGATVVLAHPHPDMGGNRFHPVVQTLYDGLPLNTVRFDFHSSSVPTATQDLEAAMALAPAGPVVLAGYSFGADITLTVADSRVLGWLLVAPPLALDEELTAAVVGDQRPKHLLVAELDQFRPPPEAARRTGGWRSTSLETVAGADHFFAGGARPVVEAARRWLERLPPVHEPLT